MQFRFFTLSTRQNRSLAAVKWPRERPLFGAVSVNFTTKAQSGAQIGPRFKVKIATVLIGYCAPDVIARQRAPEAENFSACSSEKAARKPR